MKKILFLACLLGMATIASAQYVSLDRQHPIEFLGDHLIYQGEKITLGERAFFVDGQLSDETAARYPYVFNSFNEAVEHLTDGTETQPMVLYLAPWVYWVDDPDDPEIRKPKAGRGAPFGLEIDCDWLRFEGLNPDPQNVVLASNRGQTMGAEGNFTMFRIEGDGASSENITFGNYCNIDLVFPLLPRLNRQKRGEAIVQAQLISCNSDKVVARNTRFVSRLNLCPYAGAKRALFDNCYFELTDDALCGTGLYLDCQFVFYSSRPFYTTHGTGAIFLNCDFDVISRNQQYLTKVASPVAIVDSRFSHPTNNLYLGWTGAPTDDLRCYQYNVSLNGKPILMDEEKPWLTVDMTGKPILEAYRFEYNGEVVYNTYNLLRGNDDWDPMGIKATVLAAEKANGKNYTDIPTYLRITPPHAQIESGVTTATLQVQMRRFGNIEVPAEAIAWGIDRQTPAVVKLTPSADGNTCEVAGTNENDATKTVWVTASTPSGLQSASIFTVAPSFLDAPKFTAFPKMSEPDNGKLSVNYQLDLGERNDESLITWYRCTDNKGLNALEVAVSRLKEPEYTYELSPGDIGYYIMATIAPKHLRSHPGPTEAAVTARKIEAEDVKIKDFYTDFKNFPTKYQPKVLPGFWTVDSYKPEDTSYYDWKTTTNDSWDYGEGLDGSAGVLGLYHAEKGARLLYTPTEGSYGDMSITLKASPGKAAGQGFGSATGQYMDIYIKFDTRTLSGYALRIIRTTKFSNAVDFVLVQYENGMTTEISEPVSTVCYRTHCTIELSVEGNTLKAHAQTDHPVPAGPGLEQEVNLRAEIAPNPYGGTGIQHTGSTGAGSTWLEEMQIQWK